MAALDFPASPSTGQKFPVSPLAGIPQYTWDGEKWTTIGGSTTGSAAGNATPLMDGTAAAGTATAFSREDHVHPTDTSRYATTGGTLTGDVSINKTAPALNLRAIGLTGQLRVDWQRDGLNRWCFLCQGGTEPGSNAGSDFYIGRYTDSGSLIDYPLTVTRTDGRVALLGDPTADLHAATKKYVDDRAFIGATAAEYLSNSAPTKSLTSGAVWTAATWVNVTPSGTTFTINGNLGIDFWLSLTAVGMTMANPTGMKAGQKGLIFLIQDGTGSRTITTWGSMWKFPGGTKPVLSTSAGAYDGISYFFNGVNLYCSALSGFA